MKKLTRKWLILQHYVQTAEEKMDGVTVRVFKPKMMDRLPAFRMRSVMSHYRWEYSNIFRFDGDKRVRWFRGNPDYGLYDAQVVVCYDPHRKCVDIYICALLMRPFSQEAFDHYNLFWSLSPMDLLLLMWDSRQFDLEGEYPVSPAGDISYGPKSLTYEDMFRVINGEEDIIDSSDRKTYDDK